MAKLVLDFEKSDGTKMQITDDDIMSVNSLSQITSDSSTINYGSIASTGSITIQDKWNQLEEMVLNGDIPASNAKIDLVVNDNVLQSHISSDSSFDDSSNELNITLTNRIGAWDELKYNGYIYPDESRTLFEILSDVLKSLGYTDYQISNATSTQIIYTGANDDGSKTTNIGSVEEYLKKISVEYPSIEYGKTYRQVIDDICTVSQLRCFIDDDDNLKFVSARPLASELDSPIDIPSSVILDDITGDLFIKNKYDSVEINETSVIVDDNGYIFSSDEITLLDSNNNYIAENSGVNESKYTFLRYDMEYSGYTRVSFDFDLTNTDKRINIYNSDDIRIKLNLKTNNYTYVVRNVSLAGLKSETISTGYGSVIDILTPVLSFDGVTRPSVVMKTNGTLLSFDIYLPNGGLSGAFPEGSYPYSYIQSLTVDILKTTLTFTNSNSVIDNAYESKTKAIIKNNELLQDKTTFDGKIKMSEIIKHNILSDYENGTRNLSLKIVCSDLYNSNGEKSVDFKNGEVLQSGNLVYLKGDDSKIYTVYSRDFIYDGSPETALMVESNKILPYYGAYNEGGLLLYSWDELLKTGYIIVENGSIIDENIVSLTTDVNKLIIKNNIKSIADGTSENSAFRYSYFKQIILPSSLKSIGSYAFNNSAMRNINIPDETTDIGEYAFNNCDDATELTIGESVTTIGKGAFYNCSKIKTINYNSTDCSNFSVNNKTFYRVGRDTSGVTVNISNNVKRLPENLFSSVDSVSSNNPYITSVNFLGDSKCTSISQSAFAGCSGLTTITIPNSISTIYGGAFYGCSGLTTITIPESVDHIGYFAFYGCSNLKEMTILSKDGCFLGEDAIPSNVEKIYIPKGSYEKYAERASWENYLDKLIEMDE